MIPARRRKLEAALDLIRDVNDADAWGTLTAETRGALVKLGATFGETPVPTDDDEELAHIIQLAGVTALCGFDKGEHLILRWAANARRTLAEAETQEEIPFISAFTEIDTPTEEQA